MSSLCNGACLLSPLLKVDDKHMDFSETQKQLANHLRDPLQHAPPANIEDRRLKIYRELVFNNIEGFLSGGFPILHSLYEEQSWLQLVRDFIASHQAHSPYFLEISEEFLRYLNEERQMLPSDPVFMRELAHYEWVELALDVSEEVLPEVANPGCTESLLDRHPVVSPLAWTLSYQYPVHLLGPDYRPEQVPSEPTFLIVYRNREDEVKFMESNAVTVRLLNILAGDEALTGRQALLQLADELTHPEPQQLVRVGQSLLSTLQASDVLF